MLDRKAVSQCQAQCLRLVAEEHATDLRRRVFQREVAVTRCGAAAARYFAGDPDETKVALEQEPRGRHEQRDGQDGRRCIRQRRLRVLGYIAAIGRAHGVKRNRRRPRVDRKRSNSFVQDGSRIFVVIL